MKEQSIFLTGVTGFIGKELLDHLLKDGQIIYVLIRSGKKENAQSRFQSILNELEDSAAKQLHLVEGDISLDRFGLSEIAFNELAEKISVIYHSAASVHLTAPLEEIRSTNVKGTETILQLARLAQKTHFKRLNYISTSYVAGKRSGIIYEHELNCQQSFNNNYEQAKFEAELLVEEAKKELPICIYRPSMVMGHSQTGWTSAFNVLYGPIKMGYFGNLPMVPGCNKSKIDAVPIDYITNSIVHLSQLDSSVNGKTFHLSVGLGRSISATEILEHAYSNLVHWVNYYDLQNPIQRPLMVNPTVFNTLSKILYYTASGARKEKIKTLLTYVKYTLYYKEFDNSEALKHLVPAGILAPKLQDYMDVICKYAVDHHFGKGDRPQDVYAKSSWNRKTKRRETGTNKMVKAINITYPLTYKDKTEKSKIA